MDPSPTVSTLRAPAPRSCWWWPGYVLAGIVTIALIVMVVLYIQKSKPASKSCDQSMCSGGTWENGVCDCDPAKCNSCKEKDGDTAAHCDANGTCSCNCNCDCESTCPESGGLKWDDDTKLCTTGGDWHGTQCPASCDLPRTGLCPPGYSGSQSVYDPRQTGNQCWLSSQVINNDQDVASWLCVEQNFGGGKWKFTTEDSDHQPWQCFKS